MKLFFELIMRGVALDQALKGANVTADEVKTFLESQGEQITPDQLSQQVAERVLEKIVTKLPAAQVDVDAIVTKAVEKVGAMIEEKVAAATRKPHEHIDAAAAPAVIQGKPVGYAKLHKYQQELFDMIIGARRGGQKMSFSVDSNLTDGEIAQIRAARKVAGLAGMKTTVFGGKALAELGRKALDSGSNTGAEWIPTNLADMLHMRMGEITSIADIFDTMTQSSPAEKLPLGTSRPTVYLEATTTGSGTASTPGTDAATMTAKKLIAKVDIQDDTAEDTIVNLMQFVEQALVEALVYAQADAILNGDTTATHMDSDTETVATHHNRAWKGLRRLSLGVSGLYSDLATGGLSAGNMAALIALMGKYGLDAEVERCRIILGVKGTTTWRGQFTDPQTPGAWNTLITGIMPPFLGIRPITESQNRETLNASGVYDGITKTKGCVIIVNGKGFMLSTWKTVDIEVERVASSQKNVLYAKMRKAFTPYETPSATVPVVVIGYNYTA